MYCGTFLCRVCGLQELDMYDFEKGSRFKGLAYERLKPSADLPADDLPPFPPPPPSFCPSQPHLFVWWTAKERPELICLLGACSQQLQNTSPTGNKGLLSDVNRLLPGIMQGWTALQYAAAANCMKAIQLLVSAGADINAQDGKVR